MATTDSQPHPLAQLAFKLAVWITMANVVYLLLMVTYNLFFHPLRRFPGPLLWRIFRLPYVTSAVSGRLTLDMLPLHEKYGPVVRVAPNELAFSHPSAFKDIMGHQPGLTSNTSTAAGDEKGSTEEVAKWKPFYRPVDGLPEDIILLDRAEHSRVRRQLAYGFSEKAMREQEPLITGYIDLLLRRLREHAAAMEEGRGGAVDMSAWFNFTTFDIIGDLSFGEPFGCLESAELHPWVQNILNTARLGTMLQSMVHYDWLKRFMLSLVPSHLADEHERYFDFARKRVQKRLNSGVDKPCLIEGLLQKTGEWNMSLDDVASNASLLVAAGSETTATLMSGVTWFLLTNPECMARLTDEIRSAFKSESEITMTSSSQLSYLHACLDEGLRMYPPAAIGLPRMVPKGGKVICGEYMPEGTIVCVHMWAAYHHSANWTKPFEFHPERFLGAPEFESDKRDVLQPFSYGPRACLGRNLAYAEMRLILTRIIFNFDLKLDDDRCRDWIKQKIYNFWEKPPLWIYLTPRKLT